MNLQIPAHRSRARSVQHRVVQVGVVACGVAAGVVEFLALQRRRLVGRHQAGLNRH